METYLKLYGVGKPKNEDAEETVYTGIPPEAILPPPPDKSPSHFATDYLGRLIILRDSLFMDPELFYYEEGEDDIPLCLDWARSNLSYRCYPYRNANRDSYGKRKYGYKNKVPDIARFPSLEWFTWLKEKYGCEKRAPSPTDLDTDTTTQAAIKAAINKRESINYRWEFFYTNVLLYIFEFVKNDSLIVVFFDTSLYMQELRSICNIVNCIMQTQNHRYLDKSWQMDIIRFIQCHNTYLLYTGIQHNQLYMFKSAPPTIYLVVPNDLALTEVDFLKHNPQYIQRKVTQALIRKAFPGRPFIREYNYLVSGIIDFFIDFVSKDYFTEFRFLGTFRAKQAEAISTFVALFLRNTATFGDMYLELQKKLARVFARDNNLYNIVDHSNENCVIVKIPRRSR